MKNNANNFYDFKIFGKATITKHHQTYFTGVFEGFVSYISQWGCFYNECYKNTFTGKAKEDLSNINKLEHYTQITTIITKYYQITMDTSQ